MARMVKFRAAPTAFQPASLRPRHHSISPIQTRCNATSAAIREPDVEYVPGGIPPVSVPSARQKALEKRIEEVKKAKPFSEFLTDTFNRQHDYLRISITERCNLRCLYCMPEEGIPLSPPEHMLTTPEIFYLSSLFVSQGVTKIRLTGGEPTVRRDIVPMMQQIGSLRRNGLRELALTTNGISLHRKLDAMVEAGLTGINLSLDTLDPFQFQIMTRRNGFDAVMKSINRLLEMNKLGAGVKLKVNCVVMRGLNEREIIPFVEMGREKDIEVRFIEYMPFGGNKWSQGKMISFQEMLDIIRTKYPGLRRVPGHKNDTSKTFEVPGFVGKVGFITSMTNDFCGTCNRLRITSDGNLKVCLHGNAEVSLRDVLRQGNDGKPIDQEAFERIKQIEMDRHEGRLSEETVLGWGRRERDLLDVIGAAVKRKAEKHADMGDLENMTNRPMILIEDSGAKRTHEQRLYTSYSTRPTLTAPLLSQSMLYPSISSSNGHLRLFSSTTGPIEQDKDSNAVDQQQFPKIYHNRPYTNRIATLSSQVHKLEEIMSKMKTYVTLEPHERTVVQQAEAKYFGEEDSMPTSKRGLWRERKRHSAYLDRLYQDPEKFKDKMELLIKAMNLELVTCTTHLNALRGEQNEIELRRETNQRKKTEDQPAEQIPQPKSGPKVASSESLDDILLSAMQNLKKDRNTTQNSRRYPQDSISRASIVNNPSFPHPMRELRGERQPLVLKDKVIVDDDLTIDFNSSTEELQQYLLEMRKRLRTTFRHAVDMPYQVWESKNRVTLLTWLRISVERWFALTESKGKRGTWRRRAAGGELLVRTVTGFTARPSKSFSMIKWERFQERLRSQGKVSWRSRSPAREETVQKDMDNGENVVHRVGGKERNQQPTTKARDNARREQRDDSRERVWDDYQNTKRRFSRDDVENARSTYVPRPTPSRSTTPFDTYRSIASRLYSTSSRPPLDPSLAPEQSDGTSPTQAVQPPSKSATLPHLTSKGTAHMVSVSAKPHTVRTAIAVGKVYFSNPTPLTLISSSSLKKGDVLAVSRIAGIMAAKKCPDLIPLCHPIALTSVGVELATFSSPSAESDKRDASDMGYGGVIVEAKVSCTGPTGVEMEALTSVMGAALSVVDMCKAVDKFQRVQDVRVVLKEGGKSGVWREEGWRSHFANAEKGKGED